MLNNEISRFNKTMGGKTNLHVSTCPPTSMELAEMLTSSGDIAQTLPMETIHKLWDCYIDMIEEVKERLGKLYENLLIEFHDLHDKRHEKSDYFYFTSSFKSYSFIQKYRIPTSNFN